MGENQQYDDNDDNDFNDVNNFNDVIVNNNDDDGNNESKRLLGTKRTTFSFILLGRKIEKRRKSFAREMASARVGRDADNDEESSPS